MCVSHAQISYFHCPYLMERMQNGGSGSTVSDRAFMSCVEEISPQWYNVGLEQVMKSLDAGHPLEDKLAKIRPSVTEEEVDSIGEEETTVMIISARKDALLVSKESIELEKERLLLFYPTLKMTVAKDVPEHQTTTHQQCYKAY